MKITITPNEGGSFDIHRLPPGFARMVVDGCGNPMNDLYIIHKSHMGTTTVTLLWETQDAPLFHHTYQYSENCRFIPISGKIVVEYQA